MMPHSSRPRPDFSMADQFPDPASMSADAFMGFVTRMTPSQMAEASQYWVARGTVEASTPFAMSLILGCIEPRHAKRRQMDIAKSLVDRLRL
ncbi:hypothetical protein GOP47_0021598 [Adiantum capillus-veneris]|uniref:Uncharacterized protein n=1 Tax=Adiantum capillus-veneris TaxID=13818 RepID=A0A9D4U7R6_ADICA|nr:hypothetical protein GOP47_0021598 [Adiantum capillus-veneris]